MKALKVFYSYAHKDEAHRETLETHLKLLQRQGLITGWHDRQIAAGTEWKDQIDRNLEEADLILLLISADFIASDYCWDKEMLRAVQRAETGEATVIPIILRDVDWHSAPFGKFQGLPRDGKPVTKWDDSDTAWADVSRGLRRTIEARTGAGR